MKKSQEQQQDKGKKFVDENNFNRKKVEKKRHYENPDYVALGFDDEDDMRDYEKFLR